MNTHDHASKKQADTDSSHTSQEEPISDNLSGLGSFHALQCAIKNPSKETLTPQIIIQLQRTIGNHATSNLINRRLDGTSKQPNTISRLIQPQKSIVQRNPPNQPDNEAEELELTDEEQREVASFRSGLALPDEREAEELGLTDDINRLDVASFRRGTVLPHNDDENETEDLELTDSEEREIAAFRRGHIISEDGIELPESHTENRDRSESTRTATIGPEGIEAEFSNQITDTDGVRHRTGTSAEFNPTEREFTLTRTRATGTSDDTETSHSRSASVRGNRNLDGISGMTVGTESSRPLGSRGRRMTISSSLGYDAEIAEPVGPIDDEGHYLVRGTLTWTGELGAEAGGSRLDVSLSASMGEERTFTRRFDSEEQARDWYDNEATLFFNTANFTEFGAVDSANEAANLEEGESQSTRREVGVEGSVGITLHGVRVGLTVGITASTEVEVIRSDVDHVTVHFKHRDGWSAGSNTSAAGATAGLTYEQADLLGAIIVFDVSDGENGPGWRKLDQVLNHRRIPEGDFGPGWRVSERSTGTERRGTAEGGFAGVEIAGSSFTRDEHVRAVDENNQVEEFERYTGGQEMTTSSGLPEWLVAGTAVDDHSESYEFQTDTRRGGGGATLSATIDSHDAESTHRLLADATGVPHHTGVHGNDTGSWTLSTTINEEQLKQFSMVVSYGRPPAWNPGIIGTAWVARAERMRSAIRSTANMDEARVAVRDFIASSGARGFQLLRHILGDNAMTWDVTQSDSNVWTGSDGRSQVQEQITQLRADLGNATDPTAIENVRSQIETAYRNQAQRVNTMRDTDQSPELPAQLRSQQIASNQALLDELRELRTQARTEVSTLATAQAIDNPSANTASEDRSHNLRSALEHDENRLRRKYRQTLRLYQMVAHERDIHQGRHRDSRMTFIADDDGDNDQSSGLLTSLLRRIGADSADSHERAGNEWRAGRHAWTEGDRFKHQWEEQRQTLPRDGRLDESQINAVRQLTWRAYDKYEEARSRFAQQAEIYTDIRNSYRQSGNLHAYFGDTTFNVPDELLADN